MNARPTITLASSAAGLFSTPSRGREQGVRSRPVVAGPAPRRGRPPVQGGKHRYVHVEPYEFSPRVVAGSALWSVATADADGALAFASVAENDAAARYLLADRDGSDARIRSQAEAEALSAFAALGHDAAEAKALLDARLQHYTNSKSRRCSSSTHEFGVTLGVVMAHVFSAGADGLSARIEAVETARAAHPMLSKLRNGNPETFARKYWPSPEEFMAALVRREYGDPSFLLSGFVFGLARCEDRSRALEKLRAELSTILIPANRSAERILA